MECTWTALIIFFFFLRHRPPRLLLPILPLHPIIPSEQRSRQNNLTLQTAQQMSLKRTTVATKDNISNKKSKGMTTN
jgi:hypothetical protein